jgi:hypothetical protein
VIDSQIVKSAEKGGAPSTHRAMTRARRSGVRSGHLLVDAVGLMLTAAVHPASLQALRHDRVLLLFKTVTVGYDQYYKR